MGTKVLGILLVAGSVLLMSSVLVQLPKLLSPSLKDSYETSYYITQVVIAIAFVLLSLFMFNKGKDMFNK